MKGNYPNDKPGYHAFCVEKAYDHSIISIWFYYQDVYLKRSLLFGKIYYPVREKEVLTFVAPKGYHLVHKFDEMTAIQMCEEVNRQLVKGFEWLENMKKKRKKGESS